MNKRFLKNKRSTEDVTALGLRFDVMMRLNDIKLNIAVKCRPRRSRGMEIEVCHDEK